MEILKIKNLKKIYNSGKSNQTEALSSVNFEVQEGEFIAIMGESGSGKTTLLNIIATLDKATNGEVILKGKNLNTISNKEIASYRRNMLGFVFQDFNLLDGFTNKDNIFLPLVLSGKSYNEMKNSLDSIKDILKIDAFLEKYPHEISGGQKQRIAIARAIITNPTLLLADEPTGALDSKSSTTILELFTQINNLGQTILMVTHSLKAASYASRVLFIKDGQVFNEIYRGDSSQEAFREKISDTLIVLEQGGN